MGYELHIERDEPIQLDDWKTAVAQVDGVSLVRGMSEFFRRDGIPAEALAEAGGASRHGAYAST